MENYSQEEIKDIAERTQKVVEFMKENQLDPRAQVYKENIGGNKFVDVVNVFLQDLKYEKSPKATPESVETK